MRHIVPSGTLSGKCCSEIGLLNPRRRLVGKLNFHILYWLFSSSIRLQCVLHALTASGSMWWSPQSYLLIAQRLHRATDLGIQQTNVYSCAYNFGFSIKSNCSVKEFLNALCNHCLGSWLDQSDPAVTHEAVLH